MATADASTDLADDVELIRKGMPQDRSHALAMLRIVAALERQEKLRAACVAALSWLENMRINTGDKRDQLRNKLREAIRG